jgi:hypothetical protein
MHITLNSTRAAEYEAKQKAEQDAHPTRLIAFYGRGMKVKRVTLDGVDVSMVAKWADPVEGEVAVYPHTINSDGSGLHLLEVLETKPSLPLIPNAKIVRTEPQEERATLSDRPLVLLTPLYVLSGTVEVTFHE